MTPAARIRKLLAECQRLLLETRHTGDGFAYSALSVRETALKECLKIVEEGQ